MDRITKALLTEYASVNSINELDESKQFEQFAAFAVLNNNYSESFNTADLVVGDGLDTGIDAIGIIVNGSLVTDKEEVDDLERTNGYLDVLFVFIQAKRSSSFDTAHIGQFGFGIQDFFAEHPRLPSNESIDNAREIMNSIYERSPKFRRGNPLCKLYYVTTGSWQNDANVNARMHAVSSDLKNLQLFREVEFNAIGAIELQGLYNQTKNSIARDFTFNNRTVIPEIEGVTEAFIGLLPAKDFVSLIEDENNEIVKSIFYDNVRDFQDFNAVNSEMRDTLESATERARFVLMNNGITVIAKTLRATGNKFHIEDYQVVNGCQTSHVLFNQKENLDESIMVPLRLIVTQNEEIINSIIKATNRQTQVNEDQLLALSDFQKSLELFFQTFDEGKQLFYERRSKQYNNSVGIEKTRIVSPANLIRAFASMFLSEPHRTTRNYKNLLDQVGKTIFRSEHKHLPYYTSAFALYRLEYLFRSQTLEPKFKPARYHILLAFRLLVNTNPIPQMNAHAMDRYC